MTTPLPERPVPPFPAQENRRCPGTEGAMRPRPDHGEQTYIGNGRLQGKAAIITGGDSGIGRAVAVAFAREGADVLISYLNEDADAEETARVVARGRPNARCSSPATSPMRRTAGRWSTRRSPSWAGSTSWSTTPPTR